MKPENAIEVNHVTKSFKVYLDKGRTLKEKILFQNRRKYERRTVLDGISFEVKKGEAIGLIGQNGCGKSTTLKLLTRIMYPDSGTIEMAGRVSSLIELGAGFHPDMSGRQNIYINASIFGLNRKEIDARLNDIISFSELEEFIDNPVRTYSSGMYMRLAFSVAINVDADILLIDEILAVGDANFQAKCFNKLREIKASGTTIVIVSHSLGQIEQICERSIWIQDGKIAASGPVHEVHPLYIGYMGELRQNQSSLKNSDTKKEDQSLEKGSQASIINKQRWGNRDATIVSVQTLDESEKIKSVFATDSFMKWVINYTAQTTIENASFGFAIYRSDGQHCYGSNTRVEHLKKYNLSNTGYIQIEFPHIELLPGKYFVDLAIESIDSTPIDYYTKAFQFEVFSELDDIGISRLKHTWFINSMQEN